MLETKILLLGPDGVGKTKFLYKLKLNEDINTIPTIGFNVETINYKEREIIIWDLGGGSAIKNLWKHYFQNINCIVFLIDISKKERLEDYLECFKLLLDQHKDYRNIPKIIFGNKFNDIIQFEPEELMQKSVMPPEISPVIFKGNTMTGEGVQEFLDYIYENIEFKEKEEEIQEEQEIDNKENYQENENVQKEEEKNNYKVIMLGLDNSGKTTILYRLRLGEIVTTIPTIGFNVETIENNTWNKTICLWDIGGLPKIRPLWNHYYSDIKGLIWVYDISNNEEIENSKKELINVLSNEKIENNLPLLIYANKTDKNINNNNINDFIIGIEEQLNTRPYLIQLCNYNDLESYKNGINWLCDNLI